MQIRTSRDSTSRLINGQGPNGDKVVEGGQRLIGDRVVEGVADEAVFFQMMKPTSSKEAMKALESSQRRRLACREYRDVWMT